MEYYTVNADTGIIIDQNSTCPNVQKQADYFKCSVYIIVGEHSGLTAEPIQTVTLAPAPIVRIKGTVLGF